MARLVRGAAVALLVSAWSTEASAQYKNTVFGLDAGLIVSTKPSAFNEDGTILQGSERPLRLPLGVKIGGEGNFKLDEDHWWFVLRINLALFVNSAEQDCTDSTVECKNANFDAASNANIGDLFGLHGMMGVRYFFLTDNFRPYIQFGLSYMRLFSFASGSGNVGCQDPQICSALGIQAGTNEENFLPHPNVGSIHLQPGAEFILTRDVALHVYVDIEQWIIFNAPLNQGFVFGVGINFYS